MQFRPKIWISFLLLTFLVSACAGSAEATEDPNVVLTSAVGTMVQSFFETQTAMVTPVSATPTATETKFPTPTQFVPLNPLASPTSTILFFTYTPGTPTVTGTPPTATVNASALAFGCSNLKFVRDVNYPSGTVVKPGTVFTKTWKVENNGSCNWMFLYRLAYLSGADLDPTIGTLGKQVTPGNWAELSVSLQAPNKTGTYTAYFRFSDGTHMFGETLGVTIVVQNEPTNTPQPTNTTAPANTATFTFTPEPPTPTATDTPPTP
jgi:hypothetical protein